MKLPTKQQSDLISFSCFFLMLLEKSFLSKDLIVNLNRQTEDEKNKNRQNGCETFEKEKRVLVFQIKDEMFVKYIVSNQAGLETTV